VPQTTLFDGTNNRFDPTKFDTIIRNSVTITESQTLFDSVLMSDPPFDTENGGVITVDDVLARVQNLNTTLSESTTIGVGTINRLMHTFRNLTGSISISDSITGLIQTLRNISESISVGAGSIGIVRPSSVRYIYDLGAVFDSVFFSSPPFDDTVKSYEVSDTLQRSIATFRTITEATISIGAGVVNRVLAATRTLTESISLSDSVSRIASFTRNITGISVSISDSITRGRVITRNITESAISISDSIVRVLSATRALTESISIGVGTIVRIMASFRTITESLSVSDIIQRSATTTRTILDTINILDSLSAGWGTQKTATAYITKTTANSSITKRTTNAEVAIE
jgi:hypothetical protein